MARLPAAIDRMAESYEKLLFEGELRSRFSHHMALVASERWLGTELAMLFNERASDFGLPDWAAILEKEVVDVSLIPPGTDPRAKRLPDKGIYLELKLIGAEYWRPTWKAVGSDLAGRPPKKHPADYAVCFLVNHLNHGVSERRSKTDEIYKRFHATVPLEPGEFEPVGGICLDLLRSSKEHRLEWPRPVSFRWPEGYDATVRILWITEPGRVSKLG
jgi:hypothetical protein